MNPCPCGHFGDPRRSMPLSARARRRVSRSSVGSIARPHRPARRSRAGRARGDRGPGAPGGLGGRGGAGCRGPPAAARRARHASTRGSRATTWQRRARPTPRRSICWRARCGNSACRHAPITACCVLPAASPTSRPAARCAPSTWPKRSPCDNWIVAPRPKSTPQGLRASPGRNEWRHARGRGGRHRVSGQRGLPPDQAHPGADPVDGSYSGVIRHRRGRQSGRCATLFCAKLSKMYGYGARHHVRQAKSSDQWLRCVLSHGGVLTKNFSKSPARN